MILEILEKHVMPLAAYWLEWTINTLKRESLKLSDGVSS